MALVGIYKITNRLNNKIFIGKSTDLKKSWEQHRKLQGSSNILIDKEMALYGSDKFDFSIIEECEDSLLKEKEAFYINFYGTMKNGYNAARSSTNSYIKSKDATKSRTRIGDGLKKHTERMKVDPQYRAQMIQKYKNNRPNAISVDMIDKNSEEIVMTFSKIMDGAAWVRDNTSYKKADYATINKICKGQGKTAYGYKWRYTRDR